MKRSLLCLLPLVLAACTTPTKKEPNQVPTQASPSAGESLATSMQDFGNVQLTIDAKGDWTMLTTTAYAGLISDDPKHVDDAFRRARATAYQSMAKFMSVQVHTKTRTSAKNDDDAIVHQSIDQITENASALLKGVMFDNQRIEGDRVTVRATVTPNAINSANKVRHDMQRNLQMR